MTNFSDYISTSTPATREGIAEVISANSPYTVAEILSMRSYVAEVYSHLNAGKKGLSAPSQKFFNTKRKYASNTDLFDICDEAFDACFAKAKRLQEEANTVYFASDEYKAKAKAEADAKADAIAEAINSVINSVDEEINITVALKPLKQAYRMDIKGFKTLLQEKIPSLNFNEHFYVKGVEGTFIKKEVLQSLL